MEYKFEWMLSNARSAVLARRLAEADTTKRGWQKAIAEELGVSKQYVSQVYKRFKEEQKMGGRGGSSGRGGGGVGGGSTNSTLKETLKSIDKKSFSNLYMGYSGLHQESVGTAEVIKGYDGYMVDVLDMSGVPVAGAGVSFKNLADAQQWGKSTLKKYAKQVLNGGKK